FVRYRESYPAIYRLAVHKSKWLHRLGALSIALLILFYFVPTATWLLGIRVFVSGFAYWVLAIAFAVLLGFGTRAYYSGQIARASAAANEATRVVVKKVAIPTGPVQTGGFLGTCPHCQRELLDRDQAFPCP